MNLETKCSICGEMHGGECPGDLFGLTKPENKCPWCGFYSEGGELHKRCAEAQSEIAVRDAENYRDGRLIDFWL